MVFKQLLHLRINLFLYTFLNDFPTCDILGTKRSTFGFLGARTSFLPSAVLAGWCGRTSTFWRTLDTMRCFCLTLPALQSMVGIGLNLGSIESCGSCNRTDSSYIKDYASELSFWPRSCIYQSSDWASSAKFLEMLTRLGIKWKGDACLGTTDLGVR